MAHRFKPILLVTFVSLIGVTVLVASKEAADRRRIPPPPIPIHRFTHPDPGKALRHVTATNTRPTRKPTLSAEQFSWLDALGKAGIRRRRQLLRQRPEWITEAFVKNAFAALETNKPDQARAWLAASQGLYSVGAERHDPNLEAHALYRKAWLIASSGGWRSSVPLFLQVRARFEKIGDCYNVARCDFSCGSAYRTIGRFSDALAMFDSARPLFEKAEEVISCGLCYSNSAFLYQLLGRYDEALAMYDLAEPLFAAQQDWADCAECDIKRGDVYNSMDRADTALLMYRKAERLPDAGDGGATRARCYIGFGDYYENLQDWSEALKNFKRAAVFSQHLDDDRHSLATCYAGEARIALASGRTAAASTLFSKALSIFRTIDEKSSVASCYCGLGDACRQAGDDTKAATEYQWALTSVEKLRAEIPDAELATIAWHDYDMLPSELAMIYLSQGQTARAFTSIERSKGIVLWQSLLNTSGAERPLSSEDLGLLKGLRSRYEDEEHSLAKLKASAPSLPRHALQARDRALSRLDAFEISLEARYPHTRRLVPVASAAEIGRTLGPHAMALEILVDKTGICLLTIGRRSRPPALSGTIVRVPLADVRESVRQYLDAIRDDDKARTKSMSAQLYKLLIRPIEPQLKGMSTLVICPDQTVDTVPFAALQDGHGRYLIERIAITTAPSVAAWEACRRVSLRQQKSRIPPRHLVVARSQFASSPLFVETHSDGAQRSADTITDLPAVPKEVKIVDNFYRHDVIDLKEEHATLDAVRRTAPLATSLHFATHGMFNAASPMMSALLLSPANTRDQGLLYARDIYGMRLNANLVVLSACDTAQGQSVGSEGSLGLAWAFLVAGCPSAVASQWNENDRAGLLWMKAFYAHQAKGGSKAERFRRACRELIDTRGKSQDFSSPRYWACWTLIGSDQ